MADSSETELREVRSQSELGWVCVESCWTLELAKISVFSWVSWRNRPFRNNMRKPPQTATHWCRDTWSNSSDPFPETPADDDQDGAATNGQPEGPCGACGNATLMSISMTRDWESRLPAVI